MQKTKSKNSIKLEISLLLIILSFIFNCNINLEDILENELELREGKPEIMQIDGKFYSAKKFRDEIIKERKIFEHKFDQPTPSEVENYLSNYIEESILLEKALSDVDFNSQEAKEYISRSIRKAAISYWLDKKSGALALTQNAEKMIVDEDILEKYKLLKTKDPKFKTLTMEELQREARLIKIGKLMEAATIKKRLIVGKAKRDAKVQITPKEVYSSVIK